MKQTTCEISGCTRPRHQNSKLCGAHKWWCYTKRVPRELLHAIPIRTRQRLPAQCGIVGCERAALARKLYRGQWMSLCSMHYQRLYKCPHRASIAERLIRRPGQGSYSRGYKIVHINGRTRGEHRVVMERILGRPLRRDEHVHHRNGRRDDNRPENLMIISPDEHKLLHYRIGWRIHQYSPEALRKLRDDIDALLAKL